VERVRLTLDLDCAAGLRVPPCPDGELELRNMPQMEVKQVQEGEKTPHGRRLRKQLPLLLGSERVEFLLRECRRPFFSSFSFRLDGLPKSPNKRQICADGRGNTPPC
jgi:hypothetical protein